MDPTTAAITGAALGGAVSTVITAGVTVYLQRRKIDAEIDVARANHEKIQAETQDLTSARLIRELNHIAEINDRQAQVIEQQRREIEGLRDRINAYATREAEHVVETISLRARVAELQRVDSVPLGHALKKVLPLDIPHKKNEFDE